MNKLKEHSSDYEVDDLEAVKHQSFKKYMRENYEDNELSNIVQNGCISGSATTLLYYTDTTEVYNMFADEIWDIADNLAQECGYKNVLEFLGTFDSSQDIKHDHEFKNMIVWLCAEHIACEILQEAEV